MNKQQSGFTLIELVMVIVILGILSAFALPKFADLSGDAERAATEGALGAVKSAAGIAHAAFLAGGSTDPSIENVTYNLVEGYPSSEDIDVLANLDGFGVVDTSATLVTISSSGGNCSFTYTEAQPGAAPIYSAVVCP